MPPRDGSHVSYRLADGPDWAGWRGLTAQGQSAEPLPIHWSASENVAWRTAIPGRGHSSPIVVGSQVYVSTAYSRAGVGPRDVAGVALVLVAGVLLAAGTRVGIRLVRDGLGGIGSLGLAVLLLSVAVVQATIVLSGGSLFDIARCPIRGWLAAAGVSTLSLASVIALSSTARARLVAIAAAVGLSAVTVLLVPSRAHAFRGGVFGVNGSVMAMAGAVPLLVGLAGVLRLLQQPLRSRVFSGLAALGITAVSTFLVNLLVYREGTLPAFETLRPRLGWWMIAATVALAGGAIWLWRSRPARITQPLAAVLASLAAVAAVVTSIDLLAAFSPYLAYHLGTPRLSLDVPFWAVAAAASLGLASFRFGVSDRVFKSAAVVLAALFFVKSTTLQGESRLVRAIVAIDRNTGAVEWTAEGLAGPEEPVDRRNSPATPTPVAAGDRVCAYFGNAGLMCVDRRGGQAWTRADIRSEGFYGAGASPVLAGGVLVVPTGHDAGIGLRAFDVMTGADLWNVKYEDAAAGSGMNRTPLLASRNGVAQIVVSGNRELRAFDLRTGAEIWRRPMDGGGDIVASAISNDEAIFLPDGGRMRALSPGGNAAPADKWRSAANVNCVSPIMCGGHVLAISDRGIVSAVDQQTGAIAWRQRLSGEFLASPIAAGNLAYFTNTDGVTTVLACESAARVLATNTLNEPIVASPAAAGRALYLRTDRALFSIALRRVEW